MAAAASGKIPMLLYWRHTQYLHVTSDHDDVTAVHADAPEDRLQRRRVIHAFDRLSVLARSSRGNLSMARRAMSPSRLNPKERHALDRY